MIICLHTLASAALLRWLTRWPARGRSRGSAAAGRSRRRQHPAVKSFSHTPVYLRWRITKEIYRVVHK